MAYFATNASFHQIHTTDNKCLRCELALSNEISKDKEMLEQKGQESSQQKITITK